MKHLKKWVLVLGIMTLFMIIFQYYEKEISHDKHVTTTTTSREEEQKEISGDPIACKVKEIDPFSKDVMGYMYDFGELKCQQDPDIQVTVTMKDFAITAKETHSARIRQITDDVTTHNDVSKDGFRFGEFQNLTLPFDIPRILIKNHTSALRNPLSTRCAVPVDFDYKSPPPEIDVAYTSKCDVAFADFTFTGDGVIKHVLTGKCLGPAGGPTTTPKKNHKLVISKQCGTKFDVIEDGMLHMIGTISCIHPIGGKTPKEGQKLGLWPTCPPNSPTLYFRWYDRSAIGQEATNGRYPLVNDMNHVEVALIKGKVIKSYLLSLVPKPLPVVNSASLPNIIIICIERASAQHFKRKLPKTNAFMIKMGSIEYKKHAAITSSSADNFEAMVNGITKKGTAENSIFGLAKKTNYMTMLGADDPLIADGMKKRLAVDHNSLPLFRALKKNYNIHAHKYCMTGQPIYSMTFNYLSYFLNSYPSHPKLAITLLSEICGPNFNSLSFMDGSLTDLLKSLNSLKNTMVFIQTLRGDDGGKLRRLKQGLEELKRPLLSVYVSDDIRDKYKFEATRSDELSTPFDIYVTLRHLITSQSEQKHNHGKSLLQTSAPRNCSHTGVDAAMCPCV